MVDAASLKFNQNTKDFVVVSNDNARAEAVGLTLSTKIRAANGDKVYFTQSPYAALSYYKDADPKAQAQLANLWTDYEQSWAKVSSSKHPHPVTDELGNPLDYRPFQSAGIDYGLAHQNVLIGDEPGLGKTVQAIGIANAKGYHHVLIVCPASVRKQWQKMVRRWSTIPHVRAVFVGSSRHGIAPTTNYTIISYELLRNEHLHEALCARDWDMIVLDEAHYLKTPSASRTRALFGGGRGRFKTAILAEKVEKIVALTGTPLPNRPRECFTLAKGLCHESIDWMTEEEFCFRFNPSGRMESGFVREEKGRLPELQARLRCNFMIRRLKEDVLEDLPDKQYELTYVEPDGRIKEILAKEKLIHFDITDLHDPFAEIWGQVSTVRREMGEAMAPSVKAHIEYLLDTVEIKKVVVFAHHKTVMDYLAKELAAYGVVMVRGGMSSTAKDKSVVDFQRLEKTAPRIFLGQMIAAGEGIDGLQNVASHVVFAEPSWVPKDNEQCVDRCHRMGQHNNVTAQLMVAEGSLCERILGTTIEKSHIIYDTLDRRSA
jgi:SWI/SNF-related matrix-associated actin-dependent regulator 1 of chromatin subfamily A